MKKKKERDTQTTGFQFTEAEDMRASRHCSWMTTQLKDEKGHTQSERKGVYTEPRANFPRDSETLQPCPLTSGPRR